MAHTHEYDCIVCGAHLDSSEQLAKHNKENHLKGASGNERPRQWGSSSQSSSSDKREEPSPEG